MKLAEVSPGKHAQLWRAACALVLGLALAACDPGAPVGRPGGDAQLSASAVIAVVNGERIHYDDLRGPGARGPSGNEQLEAAIARKLLAEEARRQHLDTAPALQEQIAAIRSRSRRKEEEALRDALFRSFRDEPSVSEEDLHGHYEETQARYFERHYRFRRVRFDSEAAARAGDEKLGPVGRVDPQLAEDLGPAAASDLPREILPEAMRLRVPGERVVIGAADAWQLVELVEVLSAVPRPFEAVRARVEESLRSRRAQTSFDSLLAQLRSEAQLEIDEDALAAAVAAAPSPRPGSAARTHPGASPGSPEAALEDEM